jgi:competence ComEA-like helix-hairpin-helix protein
MASPQEDEAKIPSDGATLPARISTQPRWTPLRRTDQTAVALLLVIALVWSGVQWLRSGGATGRLVDLEADHAENRPRRSVPYLVDINSADVAELGELPQVGPSLARRMIEHRERYGPFRTFDDLLRVKGIGPKTLDALRPHVRFE